MRDDPHRYVGADSLNPPARPTNGKIRGERPAVLFFRAAVTTAAGRALPGWDARCHAEWISKNLDGMSALEALGPYVGNEILPLGYLNEAVSAVIMRGPARERRGKAEQF
jgi:hypothetical protein